MFGWLRATWHQRRSEFTAQRLRDGPRYQLPKHPVGSWVFMKQVELTPGAKTIGLPPEEVIAAIEKDGYYKISGTMSVQSKA